MFAGLFFCAALCHPDEERAEAEVRDEAADGAGRAVRPGFREPVDARDVEDSRNQAADGAARDEAGSDGVQGCKRQP